MADAVTFIAYLIAEGNGDLEDIVALGTTHDEAVGLVMDAWHAYATHHHLDPDSAHPEDVAVLFGAAGDAWVNRDKQT